MKPALVILFTIGLFSTGWSQDPAPLTESEKAILLEKVESLKYKVTAQNKLLQSDAMSTFYEAIQSDSATFELYLKCHREVNFTEQKRKAQDAREAARRLKDKTSDEFVRALRHQLHWLVYSIDAARKPETRMVQAKKLVGVLEKIINDENELEYDQVLNGNGLLHQDPYNSVFAKAFKLEHLKPDSWPRTPLDFDGLYKGVILPSLIKKKDFLTSRSIWEDRIKGEALLHKNFGVESASGDTPASYDKFLEERVPQLQWVSEQILFSGGDAKDAARNLMKILESNPDHPKYMEWVDWLIGALKA